MKKFLNIALLGSLLTSSALANEDLLAKLTNGALSDNSKGVKVLSLDEMKEVKGGYVVQFKNNGVDEYYAIARYTQGEVEYIINYANAQINPQYKNFVQGLCGIDQATCSNPSANRLTSFLNVTNYSIDFFPMYSVKRNIGYGRYGKYVYFTYGVGVVDRNGQIYKFNSSSLLNNNMIIKEMANKYKEQMEYALGGWYAR